MGVISEDMLGDVMRTSERVKGWMEIEFDTMEGFELAKRGIRLIYRYIRRMMIVFKNDR